MEGSLMSEPTALIFGECRIAAETAEGVRGPASLRVQLLDSLYSMKGPEVKKYVDLAVRLESLD